MAAALIDLEESCNCVVVRQAARYMSAVYDKALAPTGLRSTQFAILHKLARLGPMTIKRLASAIAMDRTTLATNLKPLEREGLLITTIGEDKRARTVAMTDAGVVRLQEALPLWQDVQDEFEHRFGREAAAALRTSLRAVLDTGFEPWAE